ncbi:MAG: TCP-1/cpn60 chaperonin family protein [Candidatus Hodgkinia cicadicola]
MAPPLQTKLSCKALRLRGALLVKEVTSRTNEFAGDGTTTATVLLQALISEGLKAASAGVNPAALKLGIEKAAVEAVNMLQNGLRRISTHSEYVRVATIAANGDRRTGYDVADALTASVATASFNRRIEMSSNGVRSRRRRPIQ